MCYNTQKDWFNMGIKDLLSQPRKVVVNGKYQSLPSFYNLVKNVLQTEAIYVSQEIFSQEWKIADARKGRVEVISNPNNPKNFVYIFQHKNNYNIQEKIVFCVRINEKPNKKIQLIYLEAQGLKYKFNKKIARDSFYLSREEKTYNREL